MDQMPKLLQQILAELRRLNDGKEAKVRELMSLEEAADYLRLSPNTLREKVRLRQIPFYKIGGSIRFRRSKIDKWIDRGEVCIIE